MGEDYIPIWEYVKQKFCAADTLRNRPENETRLSI
jgi:hypothetical protein